MLHFREILNKNSLQFVAVDVGTLETLNFTLNRRKNVAFWPSKIQLLHKTTSFKDKIAFMQILRQRSRNWRGTGRFFQEHSKQSGKSYF